MRNKSAPTAGYSNKSMPVRITLTSAQWNHEEKPEQVRMQTKGTLKRMMDQSCWTVRYDESEATGMQGTTTQLSLYDNGSVRLKREGSVSMEVLFRKGGRFVSSMETEFGIFDLTIITNEAGGQLSEKGGDIKLAYALSLSQRESIATKLSLEVEREV